MKSLGTVKTRFHTMEMFELSSILSGAIGDCMQVNDWAYEFHVREVVWWH